MIRVEKFFIYCDGELRLNRRRSWWTRFHEGRRSLWQAHVWRDSFPWLHQSWINLGRKLRWKGMSRNWFGGCGGDGSGEEARSLSQHGGDLHLGNICRWDAKRESILEILKRKAVAPQVFSEYEVHALLSDMCFVYISLWSIALPSSSRCSR